MKTWKIAYVLIFCVLFCLNFHQAKTQVSVMITSSAELNKALLKAKPGDTLRLGNVEFSGNSIRINISGEEGKPVVIQSHDQGKARITAPVRIEGNYVCMEGISFSGNGNLEILGSGCRVSHCIFNDVKTGKWIRVFPGSSRVEIDHNLFENKTNNREMDRNCQLMQIVVRNENERHHIHHNFFTDIPKGKTGNGFETLQLITENNPFDPPGGHCNSVIENNLFIRCNGESEIISVKSNGNVIRGNVFRASQGSLVLRHGDDNEVTGNLFFGDGVKDSGGVRLQGTGQVVANNYFHGLSQLGLGMMDGTPDDLYIRVENAKILYNSFVNCAKSFVIGINHSSHPNGTVPKDCVVEGNLFYFEEPDGPENIVEFIQNDQPENWLWKNNLAFGMAGPKVSEGFFYSNPNLEVMENGMAIPTDKTPDFEVDVVVPDPIRTDLLGAKWKNRRTPGAIQYPIADQDFVINPEKRAGPYAP